MAQTQEPLSTLTKEQKNLLCRVKNEAHLIGHLVGFSDLTELHSKWIKKFWMKHNQTYVLQAHRNSYKSSCLILFIALVMIFCPNQSIIFLRKTDDDVKEIISRVSKILKTDVFQSFAQIMYGQTYRLVKDTAFQLQTSMFTDVKNGFQLLGVGIKGSLTGKHCDWLIVDDICNLSDRNSLSEREKTKDVWRELQNNILKPTGSAIAIGTPWHENDVFSLMPKADKYDCYSTGILTNEQIAEKKKNTTSALFAANYELKFIADEDAIFTNYQILYDKDIGCNLKGADVIKDGVCHVDGAFFGGDTTAFTILKKTPDGRYIVFGKMWKKHVQSCLSEILQLKEKYQAGTLYLETNSDKGYLAKEFREQGVRCLTYHESRNKYEKITSVLLPVWDKIWFIEDTDLNYINQIMGFSMTCEHDDCADSVSSLIYRSEGFKAKALEGIKI